MKKLAKKLELQRKHNFVLLNRKEMLAGVKYQHAVFGHAGVHLFD
jgi:hypothetical protein